MAVEVRPLLVQDKAQLMAILHNTPEFKNFEVDVAEELIDCYLKDGAAKSGYHLMVSEEQSRITGYICYGPTPMTEGTWDIYWMAVDRSRRGQGIGAALMYAAEDRIKKADGRLSTLETSGTPEYEPTRRFHHHVGYTIICRIPDFYAIGDDKVIFQKKLK